MPPLVFRSFLIVISKLSINEETLHFCRTNQATAHQWLLYNNQISTRVPIGQSAMVYYAGKLMNKLRVFWIII